MAQLSGIERERYEMIVTFSHSTAFRAFFVDAIKPLLDELKDDLCFNVKLTEAERLGKQTALLTLERGFEQVFKKVGSDVPEWVTKEFRFKDER